MSSNPLSSPRPTSTRTTSGRSFSTCSSAVVELVAVPTTSIPLRPRLEEAARRNCSLSSTIKHLSVIASQIRSSSQRRALQLAGITTVCHVPKSTILPSWRLAIWRKSRPRLRRVATLAAENAAPGVILDAVAQEMQALLGADQVLLVRFEPGEEILVQAYRGVDGARDLVGLRLSCEGDSATALVRETKRPHASRGTTGHRATSPNSHARPACARAYPCPSSWAACRGARSPRAGLAKGRRRRTPRAEWSSSGSFSSPRSRTPSRARSSQGSRRSKRRCGVSRRWRRARRRRRSCWEQSPKRQREFWRRRPSGCFASSRTGQPPSSRSPGPLGSAPVGHPLRARRRERRRLGTANGAGRTHGRLVGRERRRLGHGARPRRALHRRHSDRRRRRALGRE